MSARVIHTEIVPLAHARGAVLEVQIVERGPPRRWRLWITRLLLKLAGRISRLRVRIVVDTR